MTTAEEIEGYLLSQPEPKRSDMRALHDAILGVIPGCKLWFLDGRNEAGKVVSNPNIGYGRRLIEYAKGDSKEFYQIGLSGNTTGISVYILGIEDKTYLARTYAEALGKASVTGYCIKFKVLKAIDLDVLKAAVEDGVRITSGAPAAS